MRYVVVYDIESDRARTQVANILSGRGKRVQYSVFECDVTQTEARAMADRMRATLGKQAVGTSVRFYRICEPCLAASFGFGDLGALGPKDPAVIVD